jgi:hypothetical protein
MPERKAIVHSDSIQGATSSDSLQGEQSSSGDSCSQLGGKEHRISVSEQAGRGRLGVKSSSPGSIHSDDSARSDTEPRVLCHEELYGQVRFESSSESRRWCRCLQLSLACLASHLHRRCAMYSMRMPRHVWTSWWPRIIIILSSLASAPSSWRNVTC